MKTINMDDVEPEESGGGKGPRSTGNQFRRPPGFPGGSKLLGLMAMAFAVIAIFSLGSSGNLGITEIADHQVGVKINYMTGEKEVITSPGNVIYIPFLQEVFALDRTPQKYLMEGTGGNDANLAPFLKVRASDGSNLWFESLEIQYSIIPEMADQVLEDSGLGDGFKRDWIRAYARSILRDEFGRFSAVEVADPTSTKQARLRSTERMNELLNPHGLYIEQIVTPKPRFDKKYESSIEERKVADQDVERLRVKEGQLIQERAQQLAMIEKDKEIEWETLQGDLKRLELEAQREAISITKGADRYKVTREAEGQQSLDRSLAEARGLVAKYTKEAEGIRARTEALEKRGRVVVREALIDKLSSIRFSLIPYSRDPMPQRLEHTGGGAAAILSGSNTGGN
ncbi:MAG: hypothetical protein ACI9F9_001303 [Candidatus Paceibacteria bacterium]|jgi:hypothetical protein